ncbi:MAG: endolytic transglycosylase MltG [Actinobacteria bacterium]|uniref:Unannotated protein n=1 Tax=freshwater metagenome TaxID=449393 RepID=A0A6J7R785_9ZZZZ|nr:endolytic transglycosylase MltG [Actinomycetota bacterium]
MSQLESFLSSEPLPPSRHRRSVLRRVVAVLLVVIVAVLAVALYRWVSTSLEVDDYPGSGTGEVVITVSRGDSLTQIARTLAAADVVKSTDAFVAAASADDRASSLGPGKYTLRAKMSGREALALMLDPISRSQSRIVLPEGLRIGETVDTIAASTDITKKSLVDSLESPESLGLPDWADSNAEGFLFPATYEVAGDEDAQAVLTALVKRFNQASSDIGLEERADERGITPYEALIVASLVQAEGVPNDFSKVARVIYNRLDAGMPLQFDSTVSYALGIDEISLDADQLATDSPYNTYENKGLPPTPINSPGEAAIEAALSPARGQWLYFVAVNPDTKETKFTKSYDKFLEYKREFQQYLADKGKG